MKTKVLLVGKIAILLLLFVTVGNPARCQSYIVGYELNNYDYLNYCSSSGQYCESRYTTAWLRLANGSTAGFAVFEGYGSGSFIVNSKPVEVRFQGTYFYEEYGEVRNQCNSPIYSRSLTSFGNCFSVNENISTGCSTGDLSFSVAPVLTMSSGLIAGDYCENQNITLSNTSGFTNPIWQYRVSSGSWQNFNPGAGNSVTFNLPGVFGASYTSFLNQPIYFRYAYAGGNCNAANNFSNSVGPYVFSPPRPLITATNQTNPTCRDGTNSIIRVTALNRNLVSGETLTYTVYTLSDAFVAQESSGAQPSAGSSIEINGNDNTEAPLGITHGNYKILVESNLSFCGVVSYYTIPVINNPTQVSFLPSSPVSTSCHTNTTGTKNNGQVTIDPGGGTNNSFSYSLNAGGFVSAGSDPFVIGGLTTGIHSVRVRDGNNCETAPQDVTIGQPSDIVINTPSVTDINCYGGNTGQITMNSSGGTGTLQYSKDGTNFGGNIFSGLTENSYTITARDGNGCIKQTALIPIDAPDQITATVTPTAATCNNLANGSVSITGVSGGAGSFTYSINGTDFQSSATFTGLLGNPYTVTLKDGNACTITRNTTVPQPLAIGVSSTPTLVTCSGGNDGTVQITATNTNGTPTYSLNGSAFQTSNSFTNLSANTYSVTVKDGNGCTGTANTTINSNPVITGPITINTPISCNGGSNGALNLAPGGGVGPYTYIWSNGSTTEDITNLSANTYSVTVRDNVNCTQTFNRVLTQPLPITVSTTLSDYNGSNIACFGGNNGAINITPSGGNGGYTYLWSNSSTTQNLTALTAGIYTVTVTDNKSCTGNQSITLTQPAQLITSINSTQNINCFGGSTGSITLNTTGGTTDYEYSIDNGTNWQSIPTFTNLSANNYIILTRDENNCIDTDNTTLTSPNNLLLAVDNIANTTCNQNNGAFNVSATGGISNYNFTYYNSSNTQVGTGTSISNLTAGVYRVVVTDQNSCTKHQNVTISSSNGPSVTVQTVTPASCSNTADGIATISITQGQAPYTILWPNNQATATATNLAGGDYIVEVRDNTNCLALQTVTVPSPQPLTLQVTTQQDPNCSGNADGTLTVQAQGGNGSYTYNWNTGSTNNTLTNLTAGTYTLTTKDSKNCEAIQQYTLTNPPVFTIDLGMDEKICEGQVITKTLNVANGTYSWTGPNNFTSTQSQINISQAGTYSVTVTNEKGCEDSDSFMLTIDTDLLKADFLMVSEAYAGDTIIVIDISWPIPTATSWEFDQNAVIIEESPDYSLIRFDEPGTYNTTIQAQLAQCISTYSQSVIILEGMDDDGEGGKQLENVIRTVHVYPNPVQQYITIEIELSEEREGVVELFNLHANRREFVKEFTGNKHQIDWKVDQLQPGLYVVVVKVGSETKSVKVIKL